MIDVGYIPLIVLMATYFLASSFAAPRPIRLALAIPLGILALCGLAFGLHIRIPAELAHPLVQIAYAFVFPVMGVVIFRTMREHWRANRDRAS
jgi:hypothetical protein